MNDSQIVKNIQKLLAAPFAGHGLTDKEAEAAKLLAMGDSWKEAAGKLEISKPTLAARLRSACKKLKLEKPKLLTKELFKKLATILKNFDREDEHG